MIKIGEAKLEASNENSGRRTFFPMEFLYGTSK